LSLARRLPLAEGMRVRFRVSVIFVLLVVPQVAGAGGGVIIETKLSRTDYGETLVDHICPPDTPGDGGLMSIGWGFGPWQVVAALMAHDVITVNGGHDDNVIMSGFDVRRDLELLPRLDLSLRAGGFHAGIYGVDDTPLEHYRGGGVRTGAGLRFRTINCGGMDLNLTAEVIRNDLWLTSDGAKDLRDHAVHYLLGIEYTRGRDVGERCVW
jgi:hypothetical protein